jgi:hypothetical protein
MPMPVPSSAMLPTNPLLTATPQQHQEALAQLQLLELHPELPALLAQGLSTLEEAKRCLVILKLIANGFPIEQLKQEVGVPSLLKAMEFSQVCLDTRC